MGDFGSDFEAEKSSRGKRKSIYAENSDSESDEAWAPGKALKVRISEENSLGVSARLFTK